MRVPEELVRSGLDDRRHQIAGTLSGGWKQRLALVCATIHQPPLLFLDEPTSAVDPQSRREFWDSLFELADSGTTLLVSTHYMDEAERCTRLAILDHGRIAVDGSPQALLHNLPGRTWLIHAPELHRVRQALEGSAGVLSVAQIGAAIRVLSEKTEQARGAIESCLRQAGLDPEIREVSPNLEDVFVAATLERGRRTAAA